MGTYSRILLSATLLLLHVTAAPRPQDNNGIETIHVQIKIPDSTDVVQTDIPLDSTIPECVKKDAATTEGKDGLTVMADVFTDCAKGELRRIQREFDENPPPTGLQSPKGGKAEKSATEPEPEPVPETQTELTSKPKIQEKDMVDALGNATVEALNVASSPADMVAVLQTVFDYKRVMKDLRRILRGDFFGVMNEYPERVNGLFKMVQDLPKRIVGSIGIVNRLRSNTNDTTFKGVLTNLKEYLTQASKTAKNLPNAFTLVNVMDTLRNVGNRISGGELSRRHSSPRQQGSRQLSVLRDVDEVLNRQFPQLFGAQDQEDGEGARQFFGRQLFDFQGTRLQLPERIRSRFLNRRYPQQPAQSQDDMAFQRKK